MTCRALALLLMFAVPTAAVADELPPPSLLPSPSFEQAQPHPLVPVGCVEKERVPLYKRWQTWTAAGAIVTAVVVAVAVAVVTESNKRPDLTQKDFTCASMNCDGFINTPAP